MDKNRRKELEEEAKLQTDEDKELLHIITDHISLIIAHLAITGQELTTMDDTRSKWLLGILTAIIEQIEKETDEILSTIPGLPTKEESVKEVQKMQVQQWIDTAIRPKEKKDDHEE